jgi:DNA-binding NarL/FixJ family response regulator
VRVLLADDDPKVRSALRLLLENQPDTAIVGECSSAVGLLEQVSLSEASVVLLDWDLPDLHSSGVIGRLRADHPACSLVVLSCRPEQRAEAVRAGIGRFVCKGDPPESLLAALAALSEARGVER